MWEDLRMTESPEWVAECLQNRTLICVTDGSYDKQRAGDVSSAGWTMACRQTGRRISGTLVEKSRSAGSYRGEMLGMLAIRLFLLAVEEYHGVITKDNRICCDNKGALVTFEKKSKRVPSGKSNTDIQRVMRTIYARTKSNFVQRHVKAHQDEVKKWSQEKIPRITVGSLVLVLSEFKSRDLHWPVAQVLELRCDEEGVPQTAVIRLRKQITTPGGKVNFLIRYW